MICAAMKSNCYTLIHRLAPAPLQINCSYARTAIRELSASKRGNSRKQIDKHKRSREFQSIFAIPTYNLTEDLFTNHTNSLSRFDHLCERTFNAFEKNGILQTNVLNT